MADFAVALTPLHFLYLIGVITILTTMILRKDTPLVCIVFLFFIGLVASGTLTGGIQTVFTSILYAAKEFMEIIATIALITALSKCLSELGSDRIMNGDIAHGADVSGGKIHVFSDHKGLIYSDFGALQFGLTIYLG